MYSEVKRPNGMHPAKSAARGAQEGANPPHPTEGSGAAEVEGLHAPAVSTDPRYLQAVPTVFAGPWSVVSFS